MKPTLAPATDRSADGSSDSVELAARLRLAVTRLARRLRQQAEPGISLSLLSALSTVDRSGPITVGELATSERVQPPTMTRIVASLVAEGLLTRESDEADGRVAWISRTRRGQQLLQRSRKRKDAYLAKRLRELEPGEVEVLGRAAAILERMLEGEA